MSLSAEKRAWIASILGEEEAEKMLDRAVQLEKGLVAAGIQFKQSSEVGDILAELLLRLDTGQITVKEVREALGPEVGDALDKVMKSGKPLKILTRSKDIPATLGKPASLEEISAGLAKASELLAKLDTDAKKQEAQKDRADPTRRFARMLARKGTKSKGGVDAALKDDSSPIAKHVRALVDGKVEQGG